MTVDSEAIFALAERRAERRRARSRSCTARWRPPGWTSAAPDVVYLARGVGRPLWVGSGARGLLRLDAATRSRSSSATLRHDPAQAEVSEGRLVRARGRPHRPHEKFQPDRSFREATKLPAVRAPHEGADCLARLAVLAAAA